MPRRRKRIVTQRDIVIPKTEIYASAPKGALNAYRGMAAELVNRLVQCHQQGKLFFCLEHTPKDFSDCLLAVLVAELALTTIEARQITAAQLVFAVDTSHLPPADAQQAQEILDGKATFTWQSS